LAADADVIAHALDDTRGLTPDHLRRMRQSRTRSCADADAVCGLEYASLGKAGLDWRQILAALTTTAARRFGEGGQRGEIAEGMAGDVVVLGADPQDDIQAFARVHLTVRSGRIIYEGEPSYVHGRSGPCARVLAIHRPHAAIEEQRV